MTKRKKKLRSESIAGFLFVLPQLLFFAVFTIYPIFEGFRISLYKTTAVENTFVGLQNYITLFQDPFFQKSVLNTVFLVVVVTGGMLLLGMIISLAIFDKSPRYVSFVRSSIYLPVIVSAVVMGMVLEVLIKSCKWSGELLFGEGKFRNHQSFGKSKNSAVGYRICNHCSQRWYLRYYVCGNHERNFRGNVRGCKGGWCK